MDIKRALEILLTPDGRGRAKKAEILRELCDTVNPNWTRDEIEIFLKNLPHDEKISFDKGGDIQ